MAITLICDIWGLAFRNISKPGMEIQNQISSKLSTDKGAEKVSVVTIARVYVFWVWQKNFEVGCYCYADLSCPKNLNAVWDKIDRFFMPKQMVNGFYMI